jgi:hypothetical protein
MKSPKLFKYEEGNLILNKDEILLYDAFKKILKRDRGSEGDSQGRLKLYAFKEFTYIYMMCDYDSYCNIHGLSEEEAQIYAKKIAGLAINWEEDDEIIEAMDEYRRQQLDVSKELLIDLITTFRSFLQRVRFIRTGIEKIGRLTPVKEAQLTSTYDYMKELFDIAARAPVYIDTLNKALAAIEKQEKIGEEVRGGGNVDDSMDPTKAIS